jgi:asparagine synthase (glutamine-hydrolysing)
MTNIPYKKEEVDHKLEIIKYRGPDHKGILKCNDITLGHLRLAILDIDSRSNQPFAFKHLRIVFNGEIYNFEDVKKDLIELNYSFNTTSDTEVLLSAYDAWGKEMLDKINGMFAFAIYDLTKNEVFCARDRLGVKPFYYRWNKGKFEICSQLQPLIHKNSEVSKKAVSIFLDCGYVPSPFSIIKDVEKLPPGKFLVIDLNNQTKKVRTYWDLKKTKIRDLNFDQAKTELVDLLKDAIKIRLQSDVELGTFLSGGIDSALVTAIASEISKDKINTFTIGFEDSAYDESKVAEQFADILGTNHTTTFCKGSEILDLISRFQEVYDEPFADSSSLPSLLLNKITKNFVTVAISGDGGDESFIGYNHFQTVEKFIKLSRIPYGMRRILALLPLPKKIKHIIRLKSKFDFIERIFIGNQKLNKKKSKDWIQEHYSSYKTLSNSAIQQTADLNIKLWLENDSNVKVDRASMASSVEVRSPFLDYRIVEFARDLPQSFKYKDDKRKIILKEVLKDYIPENIFNQPKKGFSVPMSNWLRNELKEEVLHTLKNERLKDLNVINFDKYESMVTAHLANKNNYANEIWTVCVLSLWLDNFYKLKNGYS